MKCFTPNPAENFKPIIFSSLIATAMLVITFPERAAAQCADPTSDKCISATGIIDTNFGEDDFASEKISVEGICIYSQADNDTRAFIRNTGGSNQHHTQTSYFSVDDGAGNEIPIGVAIRSAADGTWRAISASDGYREVVLDVAEYPDGQQDCSLSGDTHYIRTTISRSSMNGAPAGVYTGMIELEVSPD